MAALTAASAHADSIVYEKGGNVWLANPDGSGQRQLTTAGGLGEPAARGHAPHPATIGGHRTNTLRIRVLPKRC